MPAGLNKDQREKAKADRMGGGTGAPGKGAGGWDPGGGLANDFAKGNLAGQSGPGKAIDPGKPTGFDGGSRGGPNVGPGAGVAPFSRTKVKKGVSRPLTPGNALTALGKVAMMSPVGAIATIAGSEEVGALPDTSGIPGLGYEGPVGESEYTESDPSQLGESDMAQAEGKTAAPPPKKKKNSPLGNMVGTLLADAGGTLVAG